MPEFDYVSSDALGLFKDRGGRQRVMDLLWGDRVRILEKNGSQAKVKARGIEGWVKTEGLHIQLRIKLSFSLSVLKIIRTAATDLRRINSQNYIML